MTAALLAFPSLLVEPVIQQRRRGRLPKTVRSIKHAAARRASDDALQAIAKAERDTEKGETSHGLINAPGIAEAQRVQASFSTLFAVGDRAICFTDNDKYGREVTIVEAYRMYVVLDDDGPYIAENGKRVEYRCGYFVQSNTTGGCIFAAAHQLTKDDCKPSHLRLVASLPATA